MKKICILGVMVFAFLLTSCKLEKQETESQTSRVDYGLVQDIELPKEISEYLESNKKQPFKTSYTSQGYMYIIVCYGEMKTSGYSIEVSDIFQTEKEIHLETKLIGPSASDKVNEVSTYPYIVLKVEECEKSVVFK